MNSPSLDPDLVPKLLVSSPQASIELRCGLRNFQIAYERPEEMLADITRGSAHLTLEQRGAGSNGAEAAAGWSIAAISGTRRECSASSFD